MQSSSGLISFNEFLPIMKNREVSVKSTRPGCALDKIPRVCRQFAIWYVGFGILEILYFTTISFHSLLSILFLHNSDVIRYCSSISCGVQLLLEVDWAALIQRLGRRLPDYVNEDERINNMNMRRRVSHTAMK